MGQGHFGWAEIVRRNGIESQLVLRSTYQFFEWDRNNSDRNFYNVVRYLHIPLVPWMQERSGATCHMAMPQCCYLAKGAKRPSHTTNTIKFGRIPFDACNSIQRFDLCPFDQKNSTYLQPPGHFVTSHLGDENFCPFRRLCPCRPNVPSIMFIHPKSPKCRSEAKRSDVPDGHASMLLLGEGSEATYPYHNYANLFKYIRKLINLINPFGRHFCRPCDRRHIVAIMVGDEMSLTPP